MCGLVGIFDLREKRQIDRELLLRMNQSQHHRGPDEDGVHIEPGVGLGHKRLSIIDVATGQQPMYSEDGQTVIVYNGEVYNFKETRRELEQLGVRFRTNGDTEVILKAWEVWGPESVKKLRGMFVFAIWDARQETLFLARDRIGIKPLHYAVLPDDTVVFASELKPFSLTRGFLATPILTRLKSTSHLVTSQTPEQF